ncbi:MAG: response regulator [Syntrophobacterales bacterium]|jgi:CheY-like chemotaxis protein|nr:response regulator [Syntrophobacterales bacterium]
MRTILFVDDEPNLTLALRMLLEAKGFRCVSLTNMTEALDFLKKENVSALVSDIMMPSGDSFPEIDSSETGFHFVYKVREQFPNIGIICLSVIGDQSKIIDLKTRGIQYLRKGETSLDKAARLIESKATGVMRFGG